MLTTLQALIIGALQGITELFPVSSLGHTVILPQVLSWQINQNDESFVIFIVATHVATALVLLAFFWRDWLNIIQGFFRSLGAKRIPVGDTYAKVAWLLIVGTIPAGLLGLLFEKKFEAYFARPSQAALFLIANGILLYGAELLRRTATEKEGSTDQQIASLSYAQAFGIGSMQALALFPGISRTGSALAGSLMAKLSHEAAARFAFLLATPIILAAGVLKLPKLIHAPHETLLLMAVGALTSALTAYLSIRFLSRYFKAHTLSAFAIYCVAAGALFYFFL